ncbi:hypothetical protein HY485_05440 [Candidatus Woesearchaeota archaeon]|nr:hypothetical protein [Candidatus Woesearchaeota archaeon]
MASEVRIIVGTSVVVLNLIPFVLKKPDYLLVTSIVSFIMLFLLDKL